MNSRLARIARIGITLLLAAIIVSLMTLTAYAIDDNADGGGSAGDSGGTLGSLDWQGYRISIVDEAGSTIMCMDTTWENPPASATAYWTNKLGGVSSSSSGRFISARSIPGLIHPVTYSGSTFSGMGIPLRSWLIDTNSSGEINLNMVLDKVFGSGTARTYSTSPYKVMFEPTVFYRPKSGPSTGYQVSPTMVYGTITNWAQDNLMNAAWNGPEYGGGGAMANFSNKVGPTSLRLDHAEPFSGGLTIPAPTGDIGGFIDCVDIINSGLGVQIYIPDNNGTHTWDYALGNTPGRAPTPPTDSTTPGGGGTPTPSPTNIYNIVKYYVNEVEQPGGSKIEIPAGNYIRENNPPKILIETEDEYELKDWFTSPTYSTPSATTKYEDTKGSLPNKQSGTSPSTVTLVNL